MNTNPSAQTLLDLNLTHGGDPDRARRIIRRFETFGFDFIHLPLYRTDHLVSSVHAPEQARWFRESQLDFADLDSLHDAAQEAGSRLVCTVYDRHLLDRYREEFDGAAVFLDPGDLTFQRLLERLETGTGPIWLGLSHPSQEVVSNLPDHLEDQLTGVLVRQPLHPEESPPLLPAVLDNLSRPKSGDLGYSATAGRPGWAAAALERDCKLLRFPLGSKRHQFPADSVGLLETFLTDLKSPDGSPANLERDDSRAEAEWQELLRDCERSLMADRSLSAGSTLQADMIRELRPGGGLPASRLGSCLNMLIPRPADPGEMIAYS